MVWSGFWELEQLSVTNLFAVWACCAYMNLGSPYPKKHLRRAQSPRRDIDIGRSTRGILQSLFFTGSFLFSARIFVLFYCCPHLLLLFSSLPQQWRVCHGCFSAPVCHFFSSQQFSSLLEIVAKLCSHVAPKFYSNSCVPQCPKKKKDFVISVNKNVVGPKTFSHER